MKLKQLINGGALAATVLTLGTAQAEQSLYDGIVFCKAKIASSGLPPEETVSISLPFTSGCNAEGGPYTYWNLGSVPPGGVADSWHSEGGPGRFVARNNGEVGAYVYLTSRGYGADYDADWMGRIVDPDSVFDTRAEFMDATSIGPTPSLREWGKGNSRYCLAFTQDIMSKIPTWHMLNMFNTYSNLYMNEGAGDGWQRGDNWSETPEECCIGAYMGHLEAGGYMTFDVKFWAPFMGPVGSSYNGSVRFTFMVEAAPFPLWEHDADVQ